VVDHLAALRRNAKRRAESLEERDSLIVAAKRAGVPVSHIADAAGLSRAQAHRIIAERDPIDADARREILEEDMQSPDPAVRLGAKFSQIPGFNEKFAENMRKIRERDERQN